MFDSLFENYERLVFFDTETTGFDAENTDQIIELAAIALDRNGKETVMDEYVRLFRLPELPDKIMQLTGILPLDLAMGKSELEALEEFVKLMQPNDGGDILLVAHNAQFDIEFLAYSIYRNRDHGKGWMVLLKSADYLDTLTVYKDRASYPHKLEAAINHYGLAGKVKNSHRAIDDVKALLEVCRAMEKEKPDLHKYVNLFGFNPKYGSGKNHLRKVAYVPQDLWKHPTAKPAYETKGGDVNVNRSKQPQRIRASV